MIEMNRSGMDLTKQKIVLLDGNSLAYRAFFALPLLTNDQGIHTNAVYGFTMMLQNPLDSSRSSRLLTAPEVTIVLAASSPAVSRNGGPTRRRVASTSKSPLPRPTSANTGRSPASSRSARRWSRPTTPIGPVSSSGRSRAHCATIRSTASSCSGWESGMA